MSSIICPCKKKSKTLRIQCCNEDCSIGWWHSSCAGFSKELTKNQIESLGCWSCPCCVNDALQIFPGSAINIDTLKNEITSDIKKCLPDLIDMAVDRFKGNCEKTEETQTVSNPIKHTLTIKPTDAENQIFTKTSWADTVKNSLPSKLSSVPISKSLLTQSGVGYMLFPDEKSRDLAKHLLQKDFVTQTGEKSVQAVFPKLRINGIDCSRYKVGQHEILKDAILKKNPLLKELVNDNQKLFDILFIKNSVSGTGFAVAKVDPAIRQVIKNNGNKIFIDMSACNVSDRLHLLQCYTCQEFGHMKNSEHCKSKDKPVCLYCSQNHLSKNCPYKKHKADHNCSNCSKSSNLVTRNNSKGHTTTSIICPFVQNEAKSLINRTMGMNAKRDAKNLLHRTVIVM